MFPLRFLILGQFYQIWQNWRGSCTKMISFCTHSHKVCWAHFPKCWAKFATYDLRGNTASKHSHIKIAVLEPRVSPAFAITYFCNHCNIRFENTSKYVDTLTLFSKNLNQRSLTPRWPLTPCLLRSHVWLYPRIIVSKSHDNTSMYVDTVINFAKYHIHTHTHTYTYTYTYYIQNEWSHSLLLNSVQARQPLFSKTWTKGHWPLDDFWPQVCWSHMCDSTQGLFPSPMTIHQSMWIQRPFFQKL